MRLIFALFGCGVGLAILGAGLVYVFAPDSAQRFLKTLAAFLGMVVVSIFVLTDLVNSLHPVILLLALMAISPVAYLIRARRQRHPERPQRLQGAERTPVMPRHVSEDEL